MSNDVHTTPISDLVPHTETRDCWCQPSVTFRCDCDSEEGCWRCENGWTAIDDGSDAIVVHNAADGRE